MNLHEYQSKQLFANYGIPVPTGYVAANAEEAVAAAKRIGGAKWVVKAQVHAAAAKHQAMDGIEELDAAAVRLENLYLGLRTDAGLPARELPENAVTGWLAAGWAVKTADRVQLTAEGWLRLDAIVASVA